MSHIPAPHVDVEELAVQLDDMAAASRVFGVQLHRVERASRTLRQLSSKLDQLQRANTPKEGGA